MITLNASHLPPAARTKLQSLRDAAADATAVSRAAFAAASEANRQVEELRREHTRLVKAPNATRPTDPAWIERAAVAKAEAEGEAQRLGARHAFASSEARQAQAVASRLEGWVRDHAGASATRDAGTVPAAPRRGETPLDAVARLREAIAAARADLRRIAAAPIPSNEAKAAVRQAVEQLAVVGTPDVGAVLEGGQIVWPRLPVHYPDGVKGFGDFDARAILAWLWAPELVARLEAEVDAAADDEAALSAEQRRSEDARVSAALLALERQEEATIVDAAASGVTILRRPDADPRAVLGLAA